jgi:hypothetical protein
MKRKQKVRKSHFHTTLFIRRAALCFSVGRDEYTRVDEQPPKSQEIYRLDRCWGCLGDTFEDNCTLNRSQQAKYTVLRTTHHVSLEIHYKLFYEFWTQSTRSERTGLMEEALTERFLAKSAERKS